MCTLLIPAAAARAEGDGQADLDEAMRVRIASPGLEQGVSPETLGDVNRAVELLQSALDKGLDEENLAFASQLLRETLIERATALIDVLQRQPAEDPRMAQIRRMAISDLRRVLATPGEFPAAKFMLARLLTAPDGDPHEARRLLNEFLAAQPEDAQMHAEALVLRGMLQTDPKRARDDFDQAIALAPEDVAVRLARAQFFRGQGDFAAALADAEAGLALEPDHLAALLTQGEVLRELGRLDEAVSALNRITQNAPQALEPYQNRGEIFRQQGEHKKAIAQFTQVLNLRPGVLLTLLHRAEAYVLEDELELALADVDAALQQQTGLVPAHRLRAQILASQDRLAEAIDGLEQLAAAMPEDAEVRMQLALYCVINKQPSKAVQVYGEVLRSQAENVDALRGRGDAYLSLGNHQAAIDDFNKALTANPKDVSLLNNLAWVLSTSPDDPVRDGKRAVELATQACELSQFKAAHILSTLAAAYAETGDFETARQWSQRAVDLHDPDHHEQLEKELASYRDNKPWRERQTVTESEAAADPPDQTPPPGPAPPEAPPSQSLDF
jgi:tetratricopeptide (TPR) repeat protein